jgi:ferredoxin-NADP reductase
MNILFDHYELVANETYTLWFKPERHIQYEAGQFAEIKIQDDNSDDRGNQRWFTISSSPTENLISITTKFTSNGSTFKKTFQNLKPGDVLTINDPLGDFVLPKLPSIPLIFIAGGSGITPVRSIVKFIVDTKQIRKVHLIYVVSSEKDLAFNKLFAEANIKYTPVLTNKSHGWEGEVGRFTKSSLEKLIGDTDNSLIYISGADNFVKNIANMLQSLGIGSKQIVTDIFIGY